MAVYVDWTRPLTMPYAAPPEGAPGRVAHIFEVDCQSRATGDGDATFIEEFAQHLAMNVDGARYFSDTTSEGIPVFPESVAPDAPKKEEGGFVVVLTEFGAAPDWGTIGDRIPHFNKPRVAVVCVGPAKTTFEGRLVNARLANRFYRVAAQTWAMQIPGTVGAMTPVTPPVMPPMPTANGGTFRFENFATADSFILGAVPPSALSPVADEAEARTYIFDTETLAGYNSGDTVEVTLSITEMTPGASPLFSFFDSPSDDGTGWLGLGGEQSTAGRTAPFELTFFISPFERYLSPRLATTSTTLPLTIAGTVNYELS